MSTSNKRPRVESDNNNKLDTKESVEVVLPKKAMSRKEALSILLGRSVTMPIANSESFGWATTVDLMCMALQDDVELKDFTFRTGPHLPCILIQLPKRTNFAMTVSLDSNRLWVMCSCKGGGAGGNAWCKSIGYDGPVHMTDFVAIKTELLRLSKLPMDELQFESQTSDVSALKMVSTWGPNRPFLVYEKAINDILAEFC